MTQITVTQQAGGTFRVQTPAGTSHEVSVPTGFAASLGCGHVAPEELVKASFGFLLEREPATSILASSAWTSSASTFPATWPRSAPAWAAAIRARPGRRCSGDGSCWRLTESAAPR